MSNQFKQMLEVSIRDFIYSELNSDLMHTSYRFVKNNSAIEFSDYTGKMLISVKNFLLNNYSCFK